MDKCKILIAGAGLGGLTAASCLMKAGFEVEVYEQAPQLGEVGAGIQLSANAMHVLIDLGLGEAISAVGVRPGAYVFRLHDSGEVLQQFSLSEEHLAKHGAPYNQLHRADFHEILATKAQALRPDLVRLGKKAVGFVETADRVELKFADGSSAQGDILIGADGVKSVVRNQIVGPVPATYTGDAAWRVTVPVEKLPKPFLPQVMSVFMGPGAHVVCYYLRAGTLLNFVGLVETDEVSEEILDRSLPVGAAEGGLCRLAFRYPDRDRRRRPQRMLPLVAAQSQTDPQLEHGACDAIGRFRACDAALPRPGRGDGDRGQRGAHTRVEDDRQRGGGAAALPAQSDRADGARRRAVECQPRPVPPARAGRNAPRIRHTQRGRRPQRLALLLQSTDGTADMIAGLLHFPCSCKG